MGAVFTILVIALALFSIVAVMYLILREKVDHEAHTRYVRSPWLEDSTQTHTTVDTHSHASDEAAAEVVVTEPEATAEPVVAEVTVDEAPAEVIVTEPETPVDTDVAVGIETDDAQNTTKL